MYNVEVNFWAGVGDRRRGFSARPVLEGAITSVTMERGAGGDNNYYYTVISHHKNNCAESTKWIGQTAYYTENPKIYEVRVGRVDGRPDINGDPPSENSGITSEPSTNHSSIPTPEPASYGNVPPFVRPVFPSERTASDTPSRSFTKPENRKPPSVVKKANTQPPPPVIIDNSEQPRVEQPSPTNNPAPEPPPPKEYTEDKNPDAEEEYIVDRRDSTEQEPDLIIEQVKRIRSDGTTETTTRREATEEELEQINKDARDAKRRVDESKEVIERDREFREITTDHPELREDTEFDRFANEFRTEIEEKRRTPFGDPNKDKRPSPIPDNKNDTKKIEPPEPDREPEKDKQPEPPDRQTPPNNDKVETKIDRLPTLEEITIAIGGLEIIRQIADKAGTASPVCLAPVLVPPVGRQVAANNRAILGFQAVNTAQNTAIQRGVNVLQRTTNTIATGVTKVQGTLGKMQQFAETAWRATRADKIMNAVTMAVTVHNGMMLSNNLLSTVSEALNMSLNALGIRDETDSPIDIGAAVRKKITSILRGVLGEAEYAALTARIAKANRIYQASVNTLHAIQDLHDSARSVAEMTAEHTGKIGNALRESGAVYEDAYEEFTEKINPQSKAMRNLDKFRGVIEGVSEPIETISQVSSEVIEIKENFTQLTEARDEWITEVNTQIEVQKTEKDTAKIENQVTAEIDDNDFEASTGDT